MPKGIDSETDSKPAKNNDNWQVERPDDFISRYTNNVHLQTSAWDMKMLFGEIDVGENSMSQHTSMNLPWRQVKILAYLLQVHEISH